APVILLLTFGIIDFGRALYLYITLQQAANEGARVAVRASYFIDPNGTSHTWPTDSDVANAIAGHAVIMNLANNPACPNGPLPNGGIPQGSPSKPAPNTGWIFITDPSTPGNGTPNGPRGGQRRRPQAGGRAAGLAAGDWWENFQDLNGVVVPKSVALYQNDLRIYTAYQTFSHTSTLVGPYANLPQDTYNYTFAGSYTLTIVATDTQFNGYEFQYTSSHNLSLAFIQIFGGSTTVPIGATATSIVGNQRQTPALLTLSTGSYATKLTGAAQLTVLGDVHTNGTACLDGNLHEAGNCYGAAGSNCNVAQYYCYNSTPGFIPYAPHPGCDGGDTIGTGVVPAPSLPDPGYLAPSIGYYTTGQTYNIHNRGTWTEMYPGQYAGQFHLSGGSASCAFLDAGVYQWMG